MTARRRLDVEMVRRGLAGSPEEAGLAVQGGLVTVGGAPATKATRMVAPGEAIQLRTQGPRFVSRGGDKLDAALQRFGIDVSGLRALDAGASTGGFTDCLLQRGAAEVVAVDVGYGQLHESLRSDPRVRNMERTNVRYLEVADLGGPFEVVVADLSFVSLRTLASRLLSAALPGAPLVLLVKPQFEAKRIEVDRGRGVIEDPAVRCRVLREVKSSLEGLGAIIMGDMESPITGAQGNVELLVHAVAPARSSEA